MCFDERKTESRLRLPAARRTLRRTFAVRRMVRSVTVAIVRSPSLLLAFLAEDVFAGVLDAFPFVGLRLAECANFSGDVANLPLIDAGDHDLSRPGHCARYAFRDRINDIVAIAELDLQIPALQRGSITDAADLEPALKTFGYACHGIGEQRTVRSPHGAGAFGIGARIDFDLAAFNLGRDVTAQRDRERALWAFYFDGLALHARGDAGGNRNRFFSDTRHD